MNNKVPHGHKIIEPPDELEGAKVIKWAWSGDKPFGLIPMVDGDSDQSIEIYGLAICRYDDSGSVYRFSCDRQWEVQQDGVYESVDDALRQLPEQYRLIDADWMTR